MENKIPRTNKPGESLLESLNEVKDSDVKTLVDANPQQLIESLIGKYDVSTPLHSWQQPNVGLFSKLKNIFISKIKNIVINVLDKPLEQQTKFNHTNIDLLNDLLKRIEVLENDKSRKPIDN